MAVEYSNHKQSQLYGQRVYYFSESGAVDSIAYLSAAGFEDFDFTQLFYHTAGKTDSCLVVDEKRRPLFRTYYKWENDREYLQVETDLRDRTKTVSSIILSKQYRDWKREDKIYKEGKLTEWYQYENMLSDDNFILATIRKNMMDGTQEHSCVEYFEYDHKGNFLDAKQYSICNDSAVWIRYKKEYEYYGDFILHPETNAYTIGNIPQLKQFEIMTPREIRIDSLTEKHIAESRKHMAEGKFFEPGVSKEEEQNGIDYFAATTQPYRNNRSRYFLQDRIDGRQVRNEDTSGELVTTPCDCYLYNDTIKVRMGIWVFGGFSFAIDIHKNEFNLTYWEDTHKQFIYKQQLSDSEKTDNITVGTRRQRLTLQSKPGYTIGENLIGYSYFTTGDYFKADDEYGRLKKHSIKGEIYFKCKLRAKTIGDQ